MTDFVLFLWDSFLISGLGVGLVSCIVPMYQSEWCVPLPFDIFSDDVMLTVSSLAVLPNGFVVPLCRATNGRLVSPIPQASP